MKAYLILSDGTVYEGGRIGSEKEAVGEIVFTTSMTGYMETLCDSAFKGQIVVQTFPIIGAAGELPLDSPSLTPALSGYIVRELCGIGSNFRKQGELNDFLIRNSVAGISGIDTRSLTRKLREAGALTAMICSDASSLEEKIKMLKAFKSTANIDTDETKTVVELNPKGKKTICVIDFGGAGEIENRLVEKGYRVVILPPMADCKNVMLYEPRGIILSDGGGEIEAYSGLLKNIKSLSVSGVPVMGISLGHLLMAAAFGASIIKLKHPHRGSNHPVKALNDNKLFISNQNHGFCVSTKGLNEDVFTTTFISANDSTNEGLDYNGYPVFSVQFKAGDKEFDRFFSLVNDANGREINAKK